MATVSIIIPTYKHRDFVLNTLESVFAQTYTNYEIIVVNDGSPDDTAKVLRPLAAAGKIRYVEQANAGQAAARNRGLTEATGEYVAFLDDDDLWPADKLEWQVNALETNPGAVLAYGYTELFGSRGESRWPQTYAPCGEVLAEFMRCNWMWSPGQCLIRRDALVKIGGLDTRIWGADDWDMYIRLARLGTFVYEDRCALRYRQHANNASHNIFRLHANTRRVMRKHLGRIPIPGRARLWFAARKSWADGFRPQVLYGSDDLLALDRKKEAFRFLLAGARLEPTLLLRPAFIRRINRLVKSLFTAAGSSAL